MNALVPATNLVDRLAAPPSNAEQRWRAQSLSQGAAGIALLHIERARTGLGTWKAAHAWVEAATRYDITATYDAGLYIGAPAISFVLHSADARYTAAVTSLDTSVIKLAHRQVDAALARIERADRPAFAEYDLFSGLTGIGRLFLQHAPGSDALGRILGYLVRLSRPSRADGAVLPGWWVANDPDPLLPTPGGHANFGLAHGITGPLALLGTALRCGVAVDGHTDAVTEICSHLDAWRQDGETGPWWPQWITREELRAGRVRQAGPMRPSWCYGIPGIARAQQIAAIAVGDTARQNMAEHALTQCLSDPAQLTRITDGGLCHGWAGLYQTVWRAANDARTPTLGTYLPHLAESPSSASTTRTIATSGSWMELPGLPSPCTLSRSPHHRSRDGTHAC